ncbi:calcium-activated chloride channel regulator 1-like [Amphiura filiformis]|uniref:calcium-activated chloride channel regulator 1-like n=1 Tax=Amphiura filiformis TaxID=82378 RepID=UPI003B21DFFE
MAPKLVFSVAALVILAVGIGHVSSLTKPSSIKLIDNAYTGVVVAIHRDVPENPELIDIIKKMFTEGSEYLYTATRKRSYFDEVTILIPKTWSSKPEYIQASNQSFDLADVIVAPPNPRWAPDPYTKQYQGCGKVGVHIHFWDLFLLEPDVELFYGPLGRILVHEWGHYRWGLFDEYPDPVGDSDNYQEFYFSMVTNQWEAVRCSYGYNGLPLKFYPNHFPYYRTCNGNEDVGYEEGCVFVTFEEGTTATSSIMYGRQYYDQITQFCDGNSFDETNFHNSEAPNKHNRLCETKSAWEVMRGTSDFENENNPPTDGDADTRPDFILVQHTDIRVVLVLDVSGSMNDDQKFVKMIGAAANYISSIVIEGSRIGIVSFAKNSKILSKLVTVYSNADRNALLDALPKTAEGATCIGCGLRTAITVLEHDGELNTEGGLILLLSDGEENEAPYIDDVKDEIVDAGVIVDTIAFTQAAEAKMYELAILTGGTPYYYSNEPGDNTLIDAFSATMERGEIDDHDRRVQLLGNSWLLDALQTRSASLYLDDTVGKNTEFTFRWTKSNYNPGIETWVITPDNTQLDSSYEGYTYDSKFKIITYKIVGTAEPGSWTFGVKNPVPNAKEEVFYTVTSYATDPNVEPILVVSELSGSITDFKNGEPVIAYAEVRQGFSPIIYADVWATIDRPGGYSPVLIQLLDNGAGADITKHDGIYSRYFTQFTTEGFYGFKITVVNNGTALKLGDRPVSRAIPNLPPEDGDKPPKIGNDTIVPPWNPPQEPTGDPVPLFTRDVSGGSSNVPEVPPGYVPDTDYIPPGRIINLRVTATSFDSKTVSLSWSAPGDDLDFGGASFYDIRIADTIAELADNFTEATRLAPEDIVTGDLNNPQEFGNTEQFVIRVNVTAETVSYAFAIQSWDDAAWSSDVSNVVLATIREYIPPTGGPPTEPGLSIGAIIGIVVGAVVAIIIVIVIIVACCCTTTKKDKKSKDKKNKKTPKSV